MKNLYSNTLFLRIFSFLIICFFNSNWMMSQSTIPYIGTPTVLPLFPGVSSSVKIVTSVYTPNLGSKINSNFTITTAQKIIDIDACYYYGMANQPKQFIDTFFLGVLPIGIYTVNQKASISISSSICTTFSTNTKTFTFEVVSNPVQILQHTSKEILDLYIYPNPTKNRICFAAKSLENAKCRLRITNALGQELFLKKDFKLEEELDISFLPHGIYSLKIETDIGQRVYKIIKE